MQFNWINFVRWLLYVDVTFLWIIFQQRFLFYSIMPFRNVLNIYRLNGAIVNFLSKTELNFQCIKIGSSRWQLTELPSQLPPSYHHPINTPKCILSQMKGPDKKRMVEYGGHGLYFTSAYFLINETISMSCLLIDRAIWWPSFPIGFKIVQLQGRLFF